MKFSNFWRKIEISEISETSETSETPETSCSTLMLFSKENLRFVGLCLLWYLSSSFTNNFGKQLLNEFKYPVTLTFVQFGLVCAFCYFGQLLGLGELQLPSIHNIEHMLPLALFQVLGHISSSIAMSRLSVSLVHTIKALSPLITVLSYRTLFGVNYSYKVYTSLIPLTAGVMLVCLNQVRFDLFGFLFAFASTSVFVSQNIFSKKLFNQSDHAKALASKSHELDKLNILFISSFLAFFLMAPVWLYSEGFKLFNDDIHISYNTIPLLFLNGFSNFSQCLLAFSILSLVSPITYSIGSLFKRIFVISVSIIYFGDKIRTAQAFGIALTFFGLYLYDGAKREVARGDAKVAAIQEKEELMPSFQREME